MCCCAAALPPSRATIMTVRADMREIFVRFDIDIFL
jgi:hypothetical protein